MSSLLIQQLHTKHGLPLLDAEQFDNFIYGHDLVILFFGNNPELFPESHDVAVILPELLKVFKQLQGAIIATAIERELQARYRFTSWPSLVFLRSGEYLGVISGIRDWTAYVEEISTILLASPSQPPGFDLDKVCGAIH